jgi:hypothetical protein
MVENVREWVLEDSYPYFGAIYQAAISTLKVASFSTHVVHFSTAGFYHQRDKIRCITA